MTAADLQLRLADLDAVIAGYGEKLAALAADPKPSYSVNGDVLDREKWREHLLKGMKDASEAQEALIKVYNNQNPWMVRTRQVVR